MRSLILMASRCSNLIVEEIGKSPFHKKIPKVSFQKFLLCGEQTFSHPIIPEIYILVRNFAFPFIFSFPTFSPPFLFSTRKEKFPC